MGDLDDLQEFIEQDRAARGEAFDPGTLPPDLFEAYVNDQVPDFESLARAEIAKKRQAELDAQMSYLREDMARKGFVDGQWVKPEPVAEDLRAPMPDRVSDDGGSPLVSPGRMAEFAEHESAFSYDAMDDRAFEDLLKARGEGRTTVYPVDDLARERANIALQSGLDGLGRGKV